MHMTVLKLFRDVTSWQNRPIMMHMTVLESYKRLRPIPIVMHECIVDTVLKCFGSGSFYDLPDADGIAGT